MRLFARTVRARLLAGVASGTLLLGAGAAMAQEDSRINIAPQSLTSALYEFGAQTDHQVMFAPSLTGSMTTTGVVAADEKIALAQLLKGTGLSYRVEGDVFIIVEGEAGSDPQSGSAAGDGAEGTVDTLIVTAQKREEDIQDVPIAISAFTQTDLEEQKIEGGFDLLKAIPNVTFSKNNFTSYNFSIRGIGTKAISATTDPGVAVSFNNIALLQNRLFEQEYFDVERVEVLRGPQGTLYGRNATAGVINVISAKPDMNDFAGSIKGELGNYGARRVVGMLNFPILEDKLAVRVAGSLTQRDGYDYNEVTQNAVNGRDLWSARVTVGFNPTDSIRANLIWEHFEEDDNRSRTGKQLCHRDPGPQFIGNTPVISHPGDVGRVYSELLRPALFSQGCQPGSLYDDAAFGTPNGLALPFVFAMLALGGDCNLGAQAGSCGSFLPIGWSPNGWHPQTVIQLQDPYGGQMQSRDLRTIASFRDPVYRAEADVIEVNLDIDITDSLTLSSQTAYNEDTVYSFQDFNRFNTVPIFTDTSELSADVACSSFNVCFGNGVPSPWADLAPDGVFCDPQLGCSDTMAGFDISTASSRQFTQELRLQSDFDAPVNFSLGANYTRFNVLADYYVFYNLISAFAMIGPFNGGVLNPGPDITKCSSGVLSGPFQGVLVDYDDVQAGCPYIDPNPIESIDGEGHNYFRSKNPYKLKSWAGFGELYWQVREDLKVTAGLRYNDDRKSFIPVPSQVLLARGIFGGGTVNRGYPEKPAIDQHWGEWTGRLGVDWKPDLSFTDDSMVYAFYSRGYKGGGANPPSPGFATADECIQQFLDAGLPESQIPVFGVACPVVELQAVEYDRTFRPEFVNAFEVGAKNTLLSGALTLNASAFYYDYKDYQVSQIRDRTAVNENFDAKTWGLELQSVFSPSRDFQLIANIGYLDTEIADGMRSIDIMNRTQGNPDYILVKPWVQLPSNCVIPTAVAEAWAQANDQAIGYFNLCGGVKGLFSLLGFGGQNFDFDDYPELNGGAGLLDDLGGNELPNAPHWTSNIGAQYGRDILDGTWRVTLRGDAYWQSQSWARVYNLDPYDKLHGWYNVNISVKLSNEDLGLDAEFYVKNLLDKSPITDAFLNSDDTALTTNVFVLDPRLVGFYVRKNF